MNNYGCWGKEPKDGYWARGIVFIGGIPEDIWVWVRDTSSKECKYDKALEDLKCKGCKEIK